MTFEEYQALAARTQRRDLPLWATREHALFGLSAEVGEVMGLYQKVHQGHPLDEHELRLEIGDVLWFVSELCDVTGWTLEEIATANIEKLRNRYPDHFSPELSMNREEYREKPKPKPEPVRSKYYAHKDGS